MFARAVLLAPMLALALAAPDADQPRPGAELITAQVRALELPKLTPGAEAELSLVLLEAPDRDMPLLVRLDAATIELLENRLDWDDVVDPLALQPRLSVLFRAPDQPGQHEVAAAVEYSVCGERWCRTKHAELRWTVIVGE